MLGTSNVFIQTDNKLWNMIVFLKTERQKYHFIYLALQAYLLISLFTFKFFRY